VVSRRQAIAYLLGLVIAETKIMLNMGLYRSMHGAYRMAQITSDIRICYKNGVDLMTSPQRTAHDLSHIMTTVFNKQRFIAR